MTYLEFLRARRVFVWYAAVVVAAAAIVLVGALLGNGIHFDMRDTTASGTRDVRVHGLSSLGIVPIPISALAALASVGALVLATALASSFNRETHYAHFTWVRPLSRVRMAVQIAAVDVAAIVATAAFTLIVALLAVSGSLGANVRYVFDGETVPFAVLGLGTAVMWYGVLQAASAWSAARGGSLVAIAATLLVAAPALAGATFLGPIVDVFRAVLFVDPLAYFTAMTIPRPDLAAATAIGGSLAMRATIVWVLAAVALAVATLAWRRVEV